MAVAMLSFTRLFAAQSMNRRKRRSSSTAIYRHALSVQIWFYTAGPFPGGLLGGQVPIRQVGQDIEFLVSIGYDPEPACSGKYLELSIC